MDKVTLNLKQSLFDLHLREMHNPSALTMEDKKKIKEKNPNLSQLELIDAEYKQAPIMTMGEGLKNLIAECKFEKIEDASDVFTWIRSIKQAMMKEKGELQVSKEEIKELIGLMDKLPKELVDPMTSGQVYGWLKEMESKFYAT